MSLQVTPAPTPFVGASQQTYASVPALLGLPGTARVPDLIREAAQRLETYSPEIDADLEEVIFTDYGNLTLHADGLEENARLVGDACRAIGNTEAIPFFLARDSRFTASAIRATMDRYPELEVVNLGARPNVLEEFEGSKWHARTSMKRVLDRLPASRLKHLGVRCGTKEEFALMADEGSVISAEDLPGVGKNGLYLSLHLSLFDPCSVPGVAHPEPGGINWDEFAEIIALIPWDRVKACDLVGLEPSGDHTGFSNLVAAKVAREVILSLAKKPAPQD
jgi:agmatinase